MLNACRAKQLYSLQVLQDLVFDYQNPGAGQDGTYGGQLLEIIADCAWAHANMRKRYSKDTPQGQDPAFKNSKDLLEELKAGSRIFVIEGMRMRDSTGTVIGRYGGQEKPDAGLMTGSTLRTDVGRPTGVWGNIPHNQYRYPFNQDDW